MISEISICLDHTIVYFTLHCLFGSMVDQNGNHGFRGISCYYIFERINVLWNQLKKYVLPYKC